MSIRGVEYYQVVCDECGEQAHTGDYSAWGDEDGALDDAVGIGWWCRDEAELTAPTSVGILVGREHLCLKHGPLLHDCDHWVAQGDTLHEQECTETAGGAPGASGG